MNCFIFVVVVLFMIVGVIFFGLVFFWGICFNCFRTLKGFGFGAVEKPDKKPVQFCIVIQPCGGADCTVKP